MAAKIAPGFFDSITRSTPEYSAYSEAVGRFVEFFAQAEVSLLYVAIHYADISPFKKGMALLAPMRVDGGITVVKRVIEARKLHGPKINELKSVLEQFSVLSKARNDLMHYGVTTYKHGHVITTKSVVHHRRLIRTRPLSLRVLQQLVGDIDDISAFLIWHFGRPGEHSDEIMKLFRKRFPLGVLPTWRYKYHEPKSRRQRRHAKPKAPARPPKSSST